MEIKTGISYLTEIPSLNPSILIEIYLNMTYTYNNKLYENYYYPHYEYNITFDYDFIWLEPGINLIYILRPDKKIRPYLAAGFFADLGIYYKNEKYKTYYFYDTEKTKKFELTPPQINRSFVGLNGGVGIFYKVNSDNFINLKLGYIRKSDKTQVNSFSTVNGLNAVISYYF